MKKTEKIFGLSETEYEICRELIENNHIPDDVTIQVLVQAREHLIRKTFEKADAQYIPYDIKICRTYYSRRFWKKIPVLSGKDQRTACCIMDTETLQRRIWRFDHQYCKRIFRRRAFE